MMGLTATQFSIQACQETDPADFTWQILWVTDSYYHPCGCLVLSYIRCQVTVNSNSYFVLRLSHKNRIRSWFLLDLF